MREALAGGVGGEELAKVLGRCASWGMGATVISMRLWVSGREGSIMGMRVSRVSAVAMRYVDGRWVNGTWLERWCLGDGKGSGGREEGGAHGCARWARDLEAFSRGYGHPVLLSRRSVQDYRLVQDAVRGAGLAHCFPMRVCSAGDLCGNGAFPVDIGEVASFLNVLGVTPAGIEGASRMLAGGDEGQSNWA
jgi:hypothetical protein